MSYNEPPNYGTPPPPPGYGDQPAFGAQPQGNSVMAIIGLVLGIIGLIPCLWGCFVFSIAATVLGFLGKKEVDAGKKTGSGLALAAIITGVIGILLSIGAWVLVATGAIDLNYTSDF